MTSPFKWFRRFAAILYFKSIGFERKVMDIDAGARAARKFCILEAVLVLFALISSVSRVSKEQSVSGFFFRSAFDDRWKIHLNLPKYVDFPERQRNR